MKSLVKLSSLLLVSLLICPSTRAQDIKFARVYNYASETPVESYLDTDIILNNRYCALALNVTETLGCFYQAPLFNEDTWECHEHDGTITLSVNLLKPKSEISKFYQSLHPFYRDLTEPEKDFVITLSEEILSTIDDKLPKGLVKSRISNDRSNCVDYFDLRVTPLYEVHLGTRKWGCTLL